ncbi:MAG: DHH family phosphoesterase [Clostridia bacterium]|nr:DHH family phosphoesterase [Clostridia bacterium]
MSNYQNLTLTEIAARIRGGVDTLVIFHRHPDGDAVGSGFALKLLLEMMGCRVLCSCDDELPERLAFLACDQQPSIKAENIPADFSPAQIITVDTASSAQVGEQYGRYAGRINLMIDHHARGEMYADGWIDGDASSAGELIYRLSRELLRTGRIPSIPTEVDRLLYAAISSDTGCFRYSNAGPDAHKAAAQLLEANFDAADINHRLFGVKSHKLLLAEKLGFERLHLFADGKVAIVDMPMSVKRQYGLTDEHLETLVDVARGLQGVQVAAAIRQPSDDGVYRVSMRSSCAVDVSAICASFGGGGHVKAAGCTIVCDEGIEAVVEMVAKVLIAAL